MQDAMVSVDLMLSSFARYIEYVMVKTAVVLTMR